MVGGPVGASEAVRGGGATVASRGTLDDGGRLGAGVGDETGVGGGSVLARGTGGGDDATVGDGCTVSGRIGGGETVRRG